MDILDSSGSYVAYGYTNASGAYISGSGLPAGTYYAATWNYYGYVDELYDDIPCLGWCDETSGTSIPVVLGATTTEVDFALSPGGRISGTVRDAVTELPLQNVSVRIYDSSENWVSSGYTDAAGNYLSDQGLLAGSYYAETSNQLGYINELFDDVRCVGPCDRASGTLIPVSEAVTTTEVDFWLDLGGRISGIVTDAVTGLPLEDIEVDIYDSSSSYVGYDFTDASGFYISRAGLPAGTYFAATWNYYGYVDELFHNIPCPGGNCNPAIGTPIPVTVGVTTENVDFELGTTYPFDELAVDFSSSGLWHYNAAVWAKLTSWNPEKLVSWEDKLAADFGSGRGISVYQASGWTKITGWDPEDMIAWGDKLAADFGSGLGIWLYETGEWTKITSWDPEDMVAWGDKLAADFGSGLGIWLHGTTGWTKITSWDAEDMVAWGDKLTADFGGSRGLWLYETSGWTKITSWDPERMVAWGEELAADFGSGRGFWLYGTSGWSKITSWDAEDMIAWGDKLAVDCGSRGLWLYETSGWTQITSWDPEKMEAMANHLAADFGSVRGLWLWETSWTKISSWDPEEMEAVALSP